MDFGLKNRRALVMGGTKGLGRSIADALAEEGAVLTISGRDQATLDEAAAALRGALLALHRTRVTAPVGGIVAKRAVQIGQRVAPGTPLLALVSLQDVWVDANFKEVQLGRIRAGQPVVVYADVYGSDVAFHGHVAGLGAGSGSAFALLPAQNASGNWIKIVQRLPVRIALDRDELAAHPLRVGLSTRVEIDVADTTGATLAGGLRTAPAPQIAVVEDADADARIRQIIAGQQAAPATTGGRRQRP